VTAEAIYCRYLTGENNFILIRLDVIPEATRFTSKIYRSTELQKVIAVGLVKGSFNE
jgi:hypothetical protein